MEGYLSQGIEVAHESVFVSMHLRLRVSVYVSMSMCPEVCVGVCVKVCVTCPFCRVFKSFAGFLAIYCFVTGYDSMGFEMSKPHLRAELERDLKW